MPLYRKKPVVIEARQYDGLNGDAVMTWVTGRPPIEPMAGAFINIHTLEGTMRAEIGDWIIKGVKGEFYPIKPDIFAFTYEPA